MFQTQKLLKMRSCEHCVQNKAYKIYFDIGYQKMKKTLDYVHIDHKHRFQLHHTLVLDILLINSR